MFSTADLSNVITFLTALPVSQRTFYTTRTMAHKNIRSWSSLRKTLSASSNTSLYPLQLNRPRESRVTIAVEKLLIMRSSLLRTPQAISAVDSSAQGNKLRITISMPCSFMERDQLDTRREKEPQDLGLCLLFLLPGVSTSSLICLSLISTDTDELTCRSSWGQPPNTENEPQEWVPCAPPSLSFVNSRLKLVSIFLVFFNTTYWSIKTKAVVSICVVCEWWREDLFRTLLDRHCGLLFVSQCYFRFPSEYPACISQDLDFIYFTVLLSWTFSHFYIILYFCLKDYRLI